MHIVYIHQYFTTPHMAGATRSFEMARRMVAAGHRVSMITSQRDQTDCRDWYTTNEAGIEVHWLPVAYSNHMSYARRILAFAQFALASARKSASIPCDVIFATSTPLTVALPAIYASWLRRVPMVFEVRDMWPAMAIDIGAIRNPLVIWAAQLLEKAAYRNAAHIVALAPGMKDDVVSTGTAPSKVTVIPNGCDLDVFGKTADSSTSPRSEHAWLGDRKLVVYVGTIGVVNGVPYLAHVASHVKKSDPEVRFVVIGAGSDWSAVQRAALQGGVLNSTFFMFAEMPKHEAAKWIRSADIAMCLITGSSVQWKDAVQNKFFDAMASGKPTASNFRGFQSIVALENGIGVILDPSDTVLAATQLVAALNDSTWLDGVAARSRVLAEGRFSRDRQAEQLVEVLMSAIPK